VVSESADACIHVLLQHAPSQRMLPPICDALMKDKNGKLRQHCAAYLLQVGGEVESSILI
jgi:hypothetical protein